jgi:hypothetical protein
VLAELSAPGAPPELAEVIVDAMTAIRGCGLSAQSEGLYRLPEAFEALT